MAFALVSDIEARWRNLSTTEETRASTLIDDASAMLASLVTVDVHDEQQAALLKTVCCSMVIRAMSSSEADNFGVSNASMTAGSYTQSWTYKNPSGDMYLTKLEKKLLGIASGYIGSIEPEINGYYGSN
jgi:hypothetical protein